jgi:hypothetical protein
MNKLLCLAAVPLVFLSACASTETPKIANGGGAKTYYCAKNRLTTQGDGLICNWADSAASSCRTNSLTTIERTVVASGPEGAPRCETGDSMVKVTTK